MRVAPFHQSSLYNLQSSVETTKECRTEKFINEYTFGDRKKALEDLPFIDPDHDNGYLLLMAIQEQDIKLLKALLKRGAKVGLDDVLGAAVRKGNKECAAKLIQFGANPESLIGTDASTNYFKMKEFLDKKIEKNKGDSPFLETGKECRTEKFINEYTFGDRKKALEDLPFIDPDHDDGYLLLMAIQERDIKLLKALLERGARVGLDDALGAAAREGDIECAKVLIQAGADPKSFIGTDVYAFIERAEKSIQSAAAHVLLQGTGIDTHHSDIKKFPDQKIEEIATNASHSNTTSTGNGQMAVSTSQQTRSPQISSLLNLPPELLTNLIKHVDNPLDTINLRMTCHKLSGMAFSQHLENFINKSALALLEKIKYPTTVIKEQKKVESTYRSAWTYLLQITDNRTALKTKEQAQASELMKILIALRPYITNVEKYIAKLFPDGFPTKLFSLLANEVHLDRCVQLVLRHFPISKETPEVATFIMSECPPLKNLTRSYDILFAIQEGKYPSLLFCIVENFIVFDHQKYGTHRNALRSLLTLLFERGCDLEQTNSKGQTVLISAVSLAAHSKDRKVVYNNQSIHEIISLLLEKGANCNARDREGFTPLMIACNSGQEEVVKLLINQPGIEINAVNEMEDSYTALDYAIPHNLSIIQTLLRQQSTNLDIGPDEFFRELYHDIEFDNLDNVQFKLLTSMIKTEVLVSILNYAKLKGNSAIINTISRRLKRQQASQSSDQGDELPATIGQLGKNMADKIGKVNTESAGKQTQI
jgi:ankyrin repeat protein